MFSQSLLNRFKTRVNVPDNWETIDVCWEWNANKDRDGYGRISDRKKQYKSHRVSWEICYGPIPEGLLVLHKCDNPSCVNPNHLFLGTHKDNTIDMFNKGRENVSIGSENGRSILTEDNILEIINGVKSGVYNSINQLTLKFGVSKTTIFHIFDNKIWKHITFEFSFDELKNLKNLIDTRSILKFDDIKDIRNRLSKNESITSIAELYNVSYNSIWYIKKNISWKNFK